MNDISTKSVEYQTLESLLIQKNPSIRFQQFKEREAKELLDSTAQQLQATLSEKTSNALERARAGSSLKMTGEFNYKNDSFVFLIHFHSFSSTTNIKIKRIKFFSSFIFFLNQINSLNSLIVDSYYVGFIENLCRDENRTSTNYGIRKIE